MGQRHPAASPLVERLSWSEVSRLAPRCVGLLPLGAACKEHGRHLPVGTDVIQARWLANRIALERPALIWPELHYGYYPAFVGYPASVSIDEAAFERTLETILDTMHGSGHRATLVLNTGISTIERVDAACRQFDGAAACHVYAGNRFAADRERLCEQRGGGHADEVETSIMMFVAPDLVDIERACDESATEFGRGPLNKDNPEGPNFTPSGAMGNPTLASARKGRKLAAAMLGDALEAFDRLASPAPG